MMVKKLVLTLLSLLLVDASKISYFWHITDIHYDELFSVHGDVNRGCWRTEGRGNRRPAGRFGDFSCDSPWELIESAAQAMKQKQDIVEFVLWTGDALSHKARRWPESRQLALLQNVTDLLKRTFSSDFVFPALGHDDPVVKKDVGELWSTWLPPESRTTFETGGYYMIERKLKKLQIIVLNTNLLVRKEERVDSKDSNEEASKKMWDWLDVILTKCRLNKEIVYLVGHHPPGVDGRLQPGLHSTPMTSTYSDHHNRKYIRLVRKYADIIVGQFFGHLHSDTFRIVYDEKDRPISWAMVAPSVTPRRTSDGPNNPGLRLYKFDIDTGLILDYTQYFLDLSKANSLQEADWQQSYTLTSYYNLMNITPASLHFVADKLTQLNVEENAYFNKYYVASSVRIHTSPIQGGCDQDCAHRHYCAITRVDYKEYKLCVETSASALASNSVKQYILHNYKLILTYFLIIMFVILR